MKTLLTILAIVIVTVASAQIQDVNIESNRYAQNLRFQEDVRQAGEALEIAGEAGNQVLFAGLAGTAIGIIVLTTSAAPGVGVAILIGTGVFILVKTIIKNRKLKRAGRKLQSHD